MSTKTEMVTELDAQINAVGKVTKTRHSTANDVFVDEFYSEIISNTKTTTSLTPQSITETTHTWLNYLTNLKKEGNKVFADGYISNTSGIIQSGFTALSFTDSDYDAKTGTDTVVFAQASSGALLQISFSGTGIYVVGAMASGVTYRFNTFYYTND